MSDRAMAWARSVKTGKSGRKTVLMVLADRASTDGVVHDCTQRDIAEEAEMSERQVRTLLQELETGGVIARERRPGSGKGRENDIIRLRMAELPLILGAQPSRQPEKSSGGQATGNARRLPQPEQIADCRSPLGLRAGQPEQISGSGGQPATGNRKNLPVAGGQPEVQSRKNLPVAPVSLFSPHTPLSELSPNVVDVVILPPPIVPPLTSEPAPPASKPKRRASLSGEARRFVEALRPSLIGEGRKRLKPADCERLLPALIAEFGFERLLAAAQAFYADCQREGGKFQPGLQVIIRDGRLADAATSHAAPAAAKPDDGLGRWRGACAIRRQTGEWPERLAPKHHGGEREPFDLARVPVAVQREYPDLFPKESSLFAVA